LLYREQQVSYHLLCWDVWRHTVLLRRRLRPSQLWSWKFCVFRM